MNKYTRHFLNGFCYGVGFLLAFGIVALIVWIFSTFNHTHNDYKNWKYIDVQSINYIENSRLDLSGKHLKIRGVIKNKLGTDVKSFRLNSYIKIYNAFIGECSGNVADIEEGESREFVIECHNISSGGLPENISFGYAIDVKAQVSTDYRITN